MYQIITIIRKNVQRVINTQGNLVFYTNNNNKEIQSIDLNYAKYLFDMGGEEELIKEISKEIK